MHRARFVVAGAVTWGMALGGCDLEPPSPEPMATAGSTSGAGAMTGSVSDGSDPSADDSGTSAGPMGTSTTAADGGSSSGSDEGPPPVNFDLGGMEDSGGIEDPCEGAMTSLPATIRDFSSAHPDFEAFWGGDPSTGLVLEQLGADGTPDYNPAPPPSPPGSSATQITSSTTFEDWYHDMPATNVAVPIEIPLTETPVGSGIYVFDDDTFFPIDMDGWNGAPGPNNETFPDSLGDLHNFHFTTEIHTSFVYEPGQVFTFNGDDDLWVFIDGTLAIDLGGLHGDIQGSVDLDLLGLVDGETYAMDIFHAERRHDGSHFRIETSIACFFPPAG